MLPRGHLTASRIECKGVFDVTREHLSVVVGTVLTLHYDSCSTVTNGRIPSFSWLCNTRVCVCTHTFHNFVIHSFMG